MTGRGAANARAARAATGAGDAIDLGRRPAGRETKRERAEETGKTRRGQREGEALWKAREDVMGDAWALSTRIPSTRGGAGAPRAAREQETTMPPREKIAMVVKRAYLRALDESSLRVGRGAPLRVPRHTITSSNFLVVRDLGPEKSWRAGLPSAESAVPVLDPRHELARSTTRAGRPGRAARATGRGSRTHLPRAVSCRTRRDFHARVFGRAHRRGSETLSIGVRRERLVDSPEAPSPGASPWVASWTPRSQLTPPRASIGSPSLSV